MHMFEQILNHTSDLITTSKSFEIFRDFQCIDFSKKCMNVSCCIELISDRSKIWAFCLNRFHSVRAVTSTGKPLVFPFKQITVVQCVTDLESGHDRFMFTVDCFGSIAQTLF